MTQFTGDIAGALGLNLLQEDKGSQKYKERFVFEYSVKCRRCGLIKDINHSIWSYSKIDAENDFYYYLKALKNTGYTETYICSCKQNHLSLHDVVSWQNYVTTIESNTEQE